MSDDNDTRGRGRPPQKDKAMAVYLLHQVGFSVQQLSEWFGVTDRQIRRILSGR